LAAIPPLDAAETAATSKKVSHDLSFLFAEVGLQLLFARTGFLTMILFAAVSDSRGSSSPGEAVWMGYAPSGTPLERGDLPSPAIIYNPASKSFDTAPRGVSALFRPKGMQALPLPKSGHLALRKRYENDDGAVPDEGYPCLTLIVPATAEPIPGDCLSWCEAETH
jgi:hypothetical protein